MTIIAADYPLLEILATMVFFFLWVVWIWTLVVVLTDVFARSGLSGWGKAAWTFFVIFLPFLGVLTYLVKHGDAMGQRAAQRTGRGPGRRGAADEIADAKHLLDTGAIDEVEYTQLKQKVLF
ncbi:MAG: hypothetical protein QOG77_3219 [Solirubrobacteraceae bacterium]|jgi:hypothetical protein|nr:hypothetical protein [Solirubrobacteraceae bacterium]